MVKVGETPTKVRKVKVEQMSTLQYAAPDCINDQCDQLKYRRWLQRKAATDAKRDRKHDTACTIPRCKAEIHAAACSSGHLDFYMASHWVGNSSAPMTTSLQRPRECITKVSTCSRRLTTRLMNRGDRDSSSALGTSTMPKTTEH